MDKTIEIMRKIAIVGDVGVGKSSMTERFASGRFVSSYDPTIENSVRKSILRKGTRIHLEIVDTAGISEYSSRLSRHSTVGVHGYILVYSITSRASLEKIRVINNLLFNTLGDPPSIPRILVATMVDLNERVVKRSQGAALAAELGIPFLECSSKTGENVEAAFNSIITEIEADDPVSLPPDSMKVESQCLIL
jgi:Ras family protein